MVQGNRFSLRDYLFGALGALVMLLMLMLIIY